MVAGAKESSGLLDVKPTSCPNPVNTTSKGVLPVAVLGTEEFNVATVDPVTVVLFNPALAEPVLVPALRWEYEDVATPYAGIPEGCLDCTEEGPDGWTDLTLKFDAQQVIAALGEVEDRQCLVLAVRGTLHEDLGGTPIVGQDVVKILTKEKK